MGPISLLPGIANQVRFAQLGWTGGQAHLLKHPAREGAGSGSVSCHLANTKLSSKERKTTENGMVLCTTWIF